MIEIVQLKKFFGPLKALGGVDLSIKDGEFFGLLGPNGAGKTTLIKMIVGLAHPTEGTVTVNDMNVRTESVKTKSLIGFSPQEINLDRYFTVRKILELQGGFYGLTRGDRKRRAEELMSRFQLSPKADRETWRLSGGMRKRLLIARALMSHPKILILDEPTAGVDVGQRHELWSFLKGLNRDGTTILLTTHYMDEAEELCDRLAIIHEGRIIQIGSPRELTQRHEGSLEDVFLKLTGKSLEAGGNECTP
ncbi:MAG: ABC transporter ATP-binding protein [Deltaproteobacteria bacterium]|nr:ABC transporter ATP-binding protein [Deltaproteobacteria bacterium]